AESLVRLAGKGTGAPADAAAWALVDLGHRLLEGGQKEEAVRIFRALLDVGPEPARIAALSGLAQAAPAEARPVLEEILRKGSERLRSAAARILEESKRR